MDALRYPIGPFAPVEGLAAANTGRWADEILGIPVILRETVRGLSAEQLRTPYRPGGWTVAQVVHHMADNDMNAYIRFKRALTEDSPTAGTYRETLWAELADYEAPVEVSLMLLDGLCGRFAALLQSLQPADFRRTFTSPALGVVTLDTAVQRFVWHDRHHTAHITSLLERSGWTRENGDTVPPARPLGSSEWC